MTDAAGAADALKEARRVQSGIVRSTRCPPYMHGLMGGFYAALVAAQGFPVQVTFSVEALVLVAVGVVFARNRQRLGFFVNGYRKGRTRWAVAGLLVPFLVSMGLAAWFHLELHLTWPALALAVLMFAVGAMSSYAWQELYRNEIEAEARSAP